ncbi:MAG: epoxyqueuosine reductase QueH [Clostridiales bacterium]|nr:epoxyqueuosine reductase QueH [Clostridiales bacterium]
MAATQNVNYHRIMIKEIENIKARQERPRLLLHSCCAPCSSYVLEFLYEYFDIEVYFFNPNIYPENEYNKRLKEQVRLVKDMGLDYRVIGTGHESDAFYEAVKGYEHMGERSRRCHRCFELRLDRVARYAKEFDFDYFTTTLTISPLKDANIINEIGKRLGKKYDIPFLQSDFKKNDGYKRSIELSKKYNLYRQDYCGCVFSKREQAERHKDKIDT